MKKFIFVLAMVAYALACAGAGEAADGYAYYPRDLRLVMSDSGRELSPGDTINVAPGQTVFIDVYPGDTNKDGVVDELDMGLIPIGTWVVAPVASIRDSANVISAFNLNGESQSLLDRFGTLAISTITNAVVDVVIPYQIGYYAAADGTGTPSALTNVFPLRVQSSPSPDLHYLFVPKSMSIRDSDGNKITKGIQMTASKTRVYEVWADDYNGNGIVDEYDYDVFSIDPTDISMFAEIITGNESILRGTTSTPNLMGLASTMAKYPTRIGTITISALNPGGTQGDPYDPEFTDFYYQITFEGTTSDGSDITKVLPYEGEIRTQTVSARINALDDAGGDGDDSGGTCDSFGAGALALLAIPCLLRRKSA